MQEMEPLIYVFAPNFSVIAVVSFVRHELTAGESLNVHSRIQDGDLSRLEFHSYFHRAFMSSEALSKWIWDLQGIAVVLNYDWL
jgi:hypothetical protein